MQQCQPKMLWDFDYEWEGGAITFNIEQVWALPYLISPESDRYHTFYDKNVVNHMHSFCAHGV